MQEKIFERFFQTDVPQSMVNQGTGIGLAIVKKAVERMGGRVGVESTVGEGSRFWLELRKA
jgi:signal transduction histidine kinase